MISVFQDLGYIIHSADKDTGFITASSPTKSSSDFFRTMAGESLSQNTKATAFVEELRPGISTIRLNFVNSQQISYTQGQITNRDTAILDPPTYQNAFDKIEDAIFIRR